MRNRHHRCWLGQTIRTLRRAKKLTQADLALAVTDLVPGTRTVTQSTVSRWENGAIDVTLNYETPLAAALGVPEAVLYSPPPAGWQTPAEQVAT